MPSLSTSQSFALATAAASADGAVLPLPDGFRVRGRARRLIVEGLVKRGLIARRSARYGEPAWAQGGSDLALKITLEGRALVGSTDPSSGDDQPLQPATPPRKRPAVRPGTKKALLVDLLRRPEGASIAEIQQATGWQPHSARAAITGLRRRAWR